ncbi:MAG: putative peptidoglycan glycosyltransferase FtsW [Planctomycetaceae bacterium]
MNVATKFRLSEFQIAERDNLGRLLAVLVGVLLCVGIQMVHSASLTSRPSEQETVFLSRHLLYLAFSLLVAWMLSRCRAETLMNVSGAAWWGLVILLVAVLIPGVGSRINGAQRWLRMAGLSLQPSELGRIILPLVAARNLCQQKVNGLRMTSVPGTLAPLLIVLPLVILEPDLGATVFLTLGFVLTLFLGGWPLRYFISCGLLLIPAAASVLVLRPYQLQRITGFMDAWKDLSSAPWQIRQSLLSLGAGGLEGSGVGAGWQKLSYLPEANTDFVFAVIGEELGLIGTLTVCFLWCAVFFTGQSVLRYQPRNSFAWIFGTTLLVQLVLQAMANIAVVTALVPPKGVPHPFISYGGTNLFVSICAVGLILGMARESDEFGEFGECRGVTE